MTVIFVVLTIIIVITFELIFRSKGKNNHNTN